MNTMPSMHPRPASAPGLVVLGGSNLISGYFLRRLAAEGRGALVAARRPVDVPETCQTVLLDAFKAGDWSAPAGARVVSILPLAALVRMLRHLENVESIVAIGSTSVLAKADSSDPHDRAIARSLAESETALTAWCANRGIHYTILRPTLVYDGVGDRNIARMARLIRRYRILPLAKPATGLRQPIHADDIAKAILGALDNEAAFDRAFNIAGGEILTYRDMAAKVFEAGGLRPRFLMFPVTWLERGFSFAEGCGLIPNAGLGHSAFRRMNQDLVFDVAPGLDVLGYRPRPFEPWAV